MEGINVKSKGGKNRKTESQSRADFPLAQQTQRETLVTQLAREDIERKAYELYLQRGGGDGHDLEDWVEAERELLGNQGQRYPS